jgi:cell pole-organizing protein PopZ
MQSEAEADLIAAVHDSLLQDPEDSLIDEEALRELVSEIIRQELQGTLGERITRSVRKLVRREIARALAGRDLE